METNAPPHTPMTEEALRALLAGLAEARARIGGDPAGWQIREVGDGNINLVFRVEGPEGGVVVKQGLPYVRLVGEGWPLPVTRAYFEHEALQRHHRLVPGLVPAPLHFDRDRALIVMELLSPHVIARQGLIEGRTYPALAADMARFMAETLFRSSDLHLAAEAKRAEVALFSANAAMCKITEDLVFTDPYREAPLNRWTTPQLDDDARRIRDDAELKAAAQTLKLKFLTEAQALIHGDLHTGSLMVTEGDTRVIDPEFATYGPMGFDVGALLANLLLAWCAQPGHERTPGERAPYRRWLLDQVVAVWTGFERRFRALWAAEATGDAYPPALFADAAGAASMARIRDRYMRALFEDALGFAGLKMIRRILGLAHVADLERIADPDRRAACERTGLAIGRSLILEGAGLTSIEAVAALAERLGSHS